MEQARASISRPPRPSDAQILAAWDRIRQKIQGGAEDPTDRWAHYRADPIQYLERELVYKGRPLRQWAFQRHAVEKLLSDNQVAIRSGRKAGKTFQLAVLTHMFMGLWPSIVVTISSTYKQLSGQLWGEIRQLWHENASKMPGRCDQLQWKVGPQHYAFGVSTDKPGNVQGFHADVEPPMDDPDRDLTAEELEAMLEEVQTGTSSGTRLVYLIDEGAEIKQPIYDAIKGSLASPNTYLLTAGNPTMDATREQEFARAHEPGSGYHRIRVQAEEGPDDPVGYDATFRAPNWLCRPEWLEDRKRDWGEDSPLYKAYVWGHFSAEGSDWKVVSPELLASSEAREVYSDTGLHMGVDLSRKGKDGCVASLVRHGVLVAQHAWRSDDAMRSAEIVVALMRKWELEPEDVHLDAGGLGGPIYDRILQMGFDVDPVDFGAAPEGDWSTLTGETAFVNRRAELHWVARRGLQEGLLQIPRKYAEHYAQAQWADYSTKVYRGATAILIQSKDEIKARFGRSPDHWDSFLIALSRAGSRALEIGGVI